MASSCKHTLSPPPASLFFSFYHKILLISVGVVTLQSRDNGWVILSCPLALSSEDTWGHELFPVPMMSSRTGRMLGVGTHGMPLGSHNNSHLGWRLWGCHAIRAGSTAVLSVLLALAGRHTDLSIHPSQGARTKAVPSSGLCWKFSTGLCSPRGLGCGGKICLEKKKKKIGIQGLHNSVLSFWVLKNKTKPQHS